ncbi:MAG: amidase family protein [Actinomycetota bacterium]
MSGPDLSSLTASSAVSAVVRGDLRSEELLDAQLERIEAHNDELNLVVRLDIERARARAREADAATAHGERWGPLHGLPMTIKDSFDTAGLVTSSGNPGFADRVPEVDAAAVAQLRRAGAIVFGKTNLPLFAGDFQTDNALHGRSRNPWGPDRTVGGSSGGAAGALAAGMTLLELGSDIGGSIRSPAHYCGVFGHKASLGVVPDAGHVPGSFDLGVMGPLGRSAADLELAMRVLTAEGVGDLGGSELPPASPTSVGGRGLRIGLWSEDGAAPTSAACRAAVTAAAAALEAAGAEVVGEVRTPTSLTDQHLLYATMLTAEMAGGFPSHRIERARDDLAAGIDDPVERARATGLVLGHADWLGLNEQRRRVIAEWHRLLDDVDVVLAPVTPVPAFPHDTERKFDERFLDVDGEQVPYWLHVVWAGLATLPLLPSTAVPVQRHEGLPVGVQIVGRRFADRTTIAVAGLLEAQLGGFVPPAGF